jgi:heterodisulfide reductase subunit C
VLAWWHKLKARAILFLLFVSQLLRRLTLRKPSAGLDRFLSQYAADAVTAVSEGERLRFPGFQKCLACSQCTFSCAAIRDDRAPSAFEPKYLLLSLGRSSHETEFSLPEWIPCLECESCTVECPNDVPVHEMAEQWRERRNRVGFRS